MRQPRANHKYLKRYMGPDGKWVYVYADSQHHTAINNQVARRQALQSEYNQAVKRAQIDDAQYQKHQKKSEKYAARADRAQRKRISNRSRRLDLNAREEARQAEKWRTNGETGLSRAKNKLDTADRNYNATINSMSVRSQIDRKIQNGIRRARNLTLANIRAKRVKKRQSRKK